MSRWSHLPTFLSTGETLPHRCSRLSEPHELGQWHGGDREGLAGSVESGILLHYPNVIAETEMLKGEGGNVRISLISLRARVDEARVEPQDLRDNLIIGRSANGHCLPSLGGPRARHVRVLRVGEFPPHLGREDQRSVPNEAQKPIPEVPLPGERNEIEALEAYCGAGIENPERTYLAAESKQALRHAVDSARSWLASDNCVRSSRSWSLATNSLTTPASRA